MRPNPRRARGQHCALGPGGDRDWKGGLGFGRLVVSETEVPNLLENLVEVDGLWCKVTVRPNPKVVALGDLLGDSDHSRTFALIVENCPVEVTRNMQGGQILPTPGV
jgi:hypothetical protein